MKASTFFYEAKEIAVSLVMIAIMLFVAAIVFYIISLPFLAMYEMFM